MVKEIRKNGKMVYFCEVCGLAFAEKEWAEKCEVWCQEHHSCNLAIMQHAVRSEELEPPQG